MGIIRLIDLKLEGNILFSDKDPKKKVVLF